MAVVVLILLLEATRVTVLRVTKEITVRRVRLIQQLNDIYFTDR